MRHLPRILIGALAAATWLAVALPATAQTSHPLYKCADRISKGLRDFTEDATRLLANCETTRLTTGTPEDCAADTDLAKALGDGPVEAVAKVAVHADCETAGVPAEEQGETKFRALCPVESRNTAVFAEHVGGVDLGSVLSDLSMLVDDLFVTPYAGCPRPTATLATAARECASRIAHVAGREAEEITQCYFSCERQNLGDNDACVNPASGVPGDDGVQSCVAKNAGDVEDILSKCGTEEVLALGCPLGASDVDGLVVALAQRVKSYAQMLNLDMYHSSCRTSLPGPPAELVPAEVTLGPSLTKKQVSCGQVLDSTFFGSDKALSFDTDLDCGPVEEATNGIVVAKSGVTISGRGKTYAILGPSRRGLRTGAGIVIAPRVKKVTVTGFRRIANFGVGLDDSGTNNKLRILKSTFFRNVQAGVRISSNKVKIVDVVADRNGIGIDVAGNKVLIKRCNVRGSEPQSSSAAEPLSPGYGIYLRGRNDSSGAGRITQCTVETNTVGVVIEDLGHRLEDSTVRLNLGEGVRIDGVGSKVRNNSIKLNVGDGVVVNGLANVVNKNHSDENGGAGYVVAGLANQLKNNGAGSPPSRGNVGIGYLVTGSVSSLDSNRAEANQGGGFSVQAQTYVFKGNRAEGNAGIGFEIPSAGNGLDSNVAETNGGFEWTVASDNLDQSGNRANGSSIVIPPAGGSFE